MQAFVVAHGARFKIVETTEKGKYDDEGEDEYFTCNGRDGSNDGTFEEVFFHRDLESNFTKKTRRMHFSVFFVSLRRLRF